MEEGYGIQILVFIISALLIGAGTRYLQKGTKIPYTVALLLIGLVLGLAERHGFISSFSPHFGQSLAIISDIDPHILLFLFLPTLIFESASSLEVHLFRRIFSQIALLAVPGLLICTLATAAVVHYALPGTGVGHWHCCLAP
ncbi:cation:proton antiporter domain-containing protein [Dongshaea marina]|uniref:cation:proton antiporter domain-containing protein n=1 Tax=Dongshaea marina TaxID=2047966 RepID=UPI001900F52C|nr:cation:proton antiporter [Dongshaea marina]